MRRKSTTKPWSVLKESPHLHPTPQHQHLHTTQYITMYIALWICVCAVALMRTYASQEQSMMSYLKGCTVFALCKNDLTRLIIIHNTLWFQWCMFDITLLCSGHFLADIASIVTAYYCSKLSFAVSPCFLCVLSLFTLMCRM